jgi:endonuclease-8
VSPFTPADAVPNDVLERMLDLARRLLQDNVVDGSSAQIQTYRNLRRTSRAMNPTESLWVYGRARKPCRRCGTPIATKKVGIEARSTYWCPRCQPAP